MTYLQHLLCKYCYGGVSVHLVRVGSMFIQIMVLAVRAPLVAVFT